MGDTGLRLGASDHSATPRPPGGQAARIVLEPMTITPAVPYSFEDEPGLPYPKFPTQSPP
jgi:hypothetical protein